MGISLLYLIGLHDRGFTWDIPVISFAYVRFWAPSFRSLTFFRVAVRVLIKGEAMFFGGSPRLLEAFLKGQRV